MNHSLTLATIATIALLRLMPALHANQLPLDAQQEFFESRIWPVLIEHCYPCHNSVDSAEGGLALDHRQALLSGGDGGQIVVPGNPQQSRLLAILRHEVDGLEMPEGGPKLDAEVVADFEQWIKAGAADPRDQPPTQDELAAATSWASKLQQRKAWWSFQGVQAVTPPQVDASSWSDHPIDRFILHKLNQAGLKPAEPADAPTLVRRLYFNLIGLPPSREQLAHWTARLGPLSGRENSSERQRVIANLVDQLLASPRFGERWARHWMDWLRYAESHGSEGDPAIDNAGAYRDYLIRALNADVPYDQLIREHIAGDLLPDPRINPDLGINESAIGPSHWRMVFHGFAPTDALDEKVRFTDDQINTFTKAFLGLTVSCARCHDHKFDAISQQDYYALFGILGSCRPARTVIDLPQRLNRHREALSALKPRIRAAIAADWLAAAGELAGKFAESDRGAQETGEPSSLFGLYAHVRQQTQQQESFDAAWQLQLAADDRRRGQWQDHRGHNAASNDNTNARWDLSEAEDYARWFAHGAGLPDRPHRAGEFAVAAGGDTALTGIYPAGVYSHLLSAKHPARLTSGDITLAGDSELWVQVIGEGKSSLRYVVQNYPRNGTVYPVTELAGRWGWQRYDLSYWSGDAIHIELAAAKDAPLLVKDEPRSWFGIRRAVIIEKGQPAPTDLQEQLTPLFDAARGAPPSSLSDLRTLLESAVVSAVKAWASDTASNAQALLLDACLRENLLPNTLASLPMAEPLLREYRRLEDEIPVPTRVPALDETVGRNQPLMHRGDHTQLGEEVPRRFLEAIDADTYVTPISGRLELAEDLLGADNPLTRRVMVNRLWHHLFGRGIVATPDNFGRLGEPPTHAELLDWLATRLDEENGSIKALVRLMVTSQTWQLSSRPAEAAQRTDPENRWLSHANLRRLEAEAIRDALLSVSGQLDLSTLPASVDGSSMARSVYVRVIRNSLDPFLRAFDFPEPFSAVGRRDVTNVPAQSLTLMNDPRVSQQAAAWARRVLSDPSLTDDQQRIGDMFLAALGRHATETELSRASDYLAETKLALQDRQQRLADLQSSVDERIARIDQLLQPVRTRMLAETKQPAIDHAEADAESAPAAQPFVKPATQRMAQPIAQWDFATSARDISGSADGQLRGGAHISGAALVVDGGGHVITAPLAMSVREKTLEAWVQLDNLDQRGGGVMTIQSTDGGVFDSIVFAEKDPRQWLAGSDNFLRTQGFGGEAESEADRGPVHVAVAWHADGRIAGYRNGKPYGSVYQTGRSPVEFSAGKAVIGFGVRHLPAGGNRMLQGRIFKARLYDQALSDEEIAISADRSPIFVSDERVLAELSEQQRSDVEALRAEITQLRVQIDHLGPFSQSVDDLAIWAELARAIFTFQEFIYVR